MIICFKPYIGYDLVICYDVKSVPSSPILMTLKSTHTNDLNVKVTELKISYVKSLVFNIMSHRLEAGSNIGNQIEIGVGPHLHKAGFLMRRVICKLVTEYMKGYISSKYMNMSTFCEIKYMNWLGFFFQMWVYD